MSNFPKNKSTYLCVASVIHENTDIFIHMEDDVCSILTVENKDLRVTLKTLNFLGYSNAFCREGAVISDDVLFND